MRLKVLSFEPVGSYHWCIDEGGKKRKIDIMVNGDISADPESLIGKTILCEYTFPDIEIAMHVKVLEDKCD